MEWSEYVRVTTTTGLMLAAIAWVVRKIIEHLFSREPDRKKIDLKAYYDEKLEKAKIDLKGVRDVELEELKAERVRELEEFRASKQSALADFQSQVAERLQRAQAALDRAERLEADLIKSRGEGYGEIWKLTGSLNLFGPMTVVNTGDLSAQLKDWYFEHGWVLTDPSKRRFLPVIAQRT